MTRKIALFVLLWFIGLITGFLAATPEANQDRGPASCEDQP